MEIDLLEPVRLGGSAQWIRIRSAKAGNPVLLLLQQGPGLPIINEARAFQRMLSLESDFTVVYWDQRRCGLSLREPAGTPEVTLGLMAQDAAGLLTLLCHRYGGPVLVAGFSMGGTVGALAAAARPDLVSALVGVGMDVDGPAAEANAYKFALAAALEQNNRRAIRRLRSIGPPPHAHPSWCGSSTPRTCLTWKSPASSATCSCNCAAACPQPAVSLAGRAGRPPHQGRAPAPGVLLRQPSHPRVGPAARKAGCTRGASCPLHAACPPTSSGAHVTSREQPPGSGRNPVR